eukprot:916647-Rhodomonas_salina.2
MEFGRPPAKTSRVLTAIVKARVLHIQVYLSRIPSRHRCRSLASDQKSSCADSRIALQVTEFNFMKRFVSRARPATYSSAVANLKTDETARVTWTVSLK